MLDEAVSEAGEVSNDEFVELVLSICSQLLFLVTLIGGR